MAQLNASCMDQDDIALTYNRDGFIAPIDVISPEEAQALRIDLETAELELSDNPEKLALLKAYPDKLLPSFDRLTRNEKLISAASAVLGPDLMVWSAGLFIKEKRSSKIVSWHQDLTYWGLDDVAETTCWVALSTAMLVNTRVQCSSNCTVVTTCLHDSNSLNSAVCASVACVGGECL